MSARKARRRPKAQKVRKLYDIQGHKLTQEQLGEYMRHHSEIERQFPQWSPAEHARRAVSDCLYRWRPSVRAAEEFKTMALYQRTQNAMHTIGSLKDIPINIAGEGSRRSATS